LEKYPEATGGLKTKTQFMIGEPTDKSDQIFRRIKAGYVNEWSIGFDALDVDYTEGDEDIAPVRNIRTIRLWEYSPVVFAMNAATTTTAVKQNGKTDDPENTEETPAVDNIDYAALVERLEKLSTEITKQLEEMKTLNTNQPSDKVGSEDDAPASEAEKTEAVEAKRKELLARLRKDTGDGN